MRPSGAQNHSAASEGHEPVAPQQGGKLEQLKRSWWIVFTLAPSAGSPSSLSSTPVARPHGGHGSCGHWPISSSPGAPPF